MQISIEKFDYEAQLGELRGDVAKIKQVGGAAMPAPPSSSTAVASEGGCLVSPAGLCCHSIQNLALCYVHAQSVLHMC